MSKQHTAHKFLFTAFKAPVGLHRVNSSILDTIHVVKYIPRQQTNYTPL